jgi:hypothetical protein
MLEHTKEAKRFYRSKAWLDCRRSYIQSVFGLCERCHQPGYIVHHKTYMTAKNIHDVNITLNHDNLEYLCLTCHNREHFERNSPVREGLTFDSQGNLVMRERDT